MSAIILSLHGVVFDILVGRQNERARGGLISARSTAAGRTTPRSRSRPRRATAPRTTAGAAPMAADWARMGSMIAAPGPYLAAEDIIGPAGVAEDQRDQHGDADQHEGLAVLGRGRLPDGNAL